jgi:hypothetical protein
MEERMLRDILIAADVVLAAKVKQFPKRFR